MKQEIIEFCNDPEDAIVILINGESGSGKTLFARALVEELKKAEVSSLPEWANREHLHILASSLNPESSKLFLNMWQPIFKSVIRCVLYRAAAEHPEATDEPTEKVHTDQLPEPILRPDLRQ